MTNTELARMAERAGILLGTRDPLRWKCLYRIDKRWGDWTDAQVAAGLAPAPYESHEEVGNLLMLNGANLLWSGLTTAGLSTPFNTTNAMIAVGDQSNAAVNLDQDVGGGCTVSVGTGITGVSNATNPTITTTAAHSLNVGDTVYISGVTMSSGNNVNGTWVVATTPSSTTFTITTNGITAGVYSSGGTVKTGTALSGTITGTTAGASSVITMSAAVSGSMVPGQTVVIGGVNPSAYNGAWLVTAVSGSTFTINNTSNLGTYVSGGSNVKFYNKARQAASSVTIQSGLNQNQVQFVATFGTAVANNAWNEWALCNTGAATQPQLPTATSLLNHAVTGLGTKTSAASWTFTVTLTLS